MRMNESFVCIHFNFIEMLKYWVILGMVSLLFSCTGSADKAEDVPATVSLFTVNARDTLLESEYVADIHACRYIEIRSRQAGMLEEIWVEEGQSVKAGQPLFRLSTTELSLKVNAAKAQVHLQEAELQKAKVEADRVKLLVEKQVVSFSDMELALAEVKIAESRLEGARSELTSAETHLSYATIRAPFSGLINRFHLKAGSRVDEGSLLTTLSDISSVYVYFNISEKAYLKYQNTENGQEIPQEVKLRLADQSLFQSLGKIETTESEFNENTGSIAVRAKFDNPNRILRHASGGTILLPHKLSDALLIPQTAVLELQDKYYVCIPDSNNIIRMRSIVPEVRLGNAFVVREGIVQGEKIVISGVQELREGQKVLPQSLLASSTSNP